MDVVIHGDMDIGILLSVLMGFIFVSGWHCIWEAECPFCSRCFRYSANKHV